MDPLTSRQHSILNRVVDSHIDTAEPVGSKLVTDAYRERYLATFSPATVRYEMGVLEDKGYLTHPHTSAGRIPTDLGYRYYLNHCVSEETLPRSFVSDLEDSAANGFERLDSLLEKTVRILSGLADEYSLILVAETGERAGAGRTAPRLYSQGTSRLLNKPEFQDVRKVRELFELLENKEEIIQFLTAQASSDKVTVTLGMENPADAFHDCAVVSTACFRRGERTGVIALLGPKRMRYARALPLVCRMGKILGRILEDRSGD